MKNILMLAVMLIGLTVGGYAQANVGFAWDYGTPMPTGFEITTTPTSGPAIITDCGAAPTKTCTISGIPAGSYSSFLRAYAIGVPAALKAYSDQSNTVVFTVPVKPAAPANDRLNAATMVLNLTWPAGTQLAMDINVPSDKPTN